MSRKIDAMHELFGQHEGKCKDCRNLKCHVYNYDKRYYKCAVYGVSSSMATDWRLSWDACGMFNSLWIGKPIMELTKYESKREPTLPPDGQIALDSMEGIAMDRDVYIVKEDNIELAVCMTLEVALMLVDARFNSYGCDCGTISITKKVQEDE